MENGSWTTDTRIYPGIDSQLYTDGDKTRVALSSIR